MPLQDHPPKLIVGITSIIGLTGMEGSGWYGLSNEILNLYLHLQYKFLTPNNAISFPRRRRESKNKSSPSPTASGTKSAWAPKLGSVDRLAEKGIGAIPVKEGIKHFRQLVEGNPGTQQIIVAARVAGIATWKND